MLKKSITYEDFNGETVSEDFFFHLSKAELVELELSHEGGLSAALERIIAAEDGKSIIAEFKNIILSSYGVRSEDGRRFVKNQTLRDEFESTEAYSTLFMELVTDTEAAVVFINGVIPADMVAEAARLAQTEQPAQTEPKPELEAVPVPEVPAPEVPAPTSEPTVLGRAEIARMSREELATLGDRIQAGEVVLAPEVESQI